MDNTDLQQLQGALPDEIISTLGEEEKTRIEESLGIYKSINPMTLPNNVSFFGEYGLETGFLLASAIGAIVVSALRVGTILLVSEANLSKTNAQAETMVGGLGGVFTLAPILIMIAGLLAFEAFLFAAGYRKGRESGIVRIPFWGILTAFVVTISAGLLSAMSLDKSVNYGALQQVVLGVVIASTAVGAPLIAYFGAENIGVIHNSYLLAKKDHVKEVARVKREWYANFMAYYRKNAIKIFGVDRADHRQPAVIPEDKGERVEVQARVAKYLKDQNIDAFQIGLGEEYAMSPAQFVLEMATQKPHYSPCVRKQANRTMDKGDIP